MRTRSLLQTVEHLSHGLSLSSLLTLSLTLSLRGRGKGEGRRAGARKKSEGISDAFVLGTIAAFIAVLLFPAPIVLAALLEEMLATRKPEATIDLATQAGVQL